MDRDCVKVRHRHKVGCNFFDEGGEPCAGALQWRDRFRRPVMGFESASPDHRD